jgi:hypothetical protein
MRLAEICISVLSSSSIQTTPQAGSTMTAMLRRPMFIIETFDPGCQPRHRPTAPLVAIRIDTSRSRTQSPA